MGDNRIVSDEELLELRERVARIQEKKAIEEEERRARWIKYYEQLAKHAPFGGSEKGGGRTYRWD